MTDIQDIDLGEKINILSELSESLTSVSPQEFLQILPAKVCSLLNVPTCIIWQANQEKKVLQILATAGDLDDEYRNITLNLKSSEIKKIFKKNKISFLENANKAKNKSYRFEYLAEINKGKFTSIATIPLKKQKKKLGVIDIFIQDKHVLETWKKKYLTL